MRSAGLCQVGNAVAKDSAMKKKKSKSLYHGHRWHCVMEILRDHLANVTEPPCRTRVVRHAATPRRRLDLVLTGVEDAKWGRLCISPRPNEKYRDKQGRQYSKAPDRRERARPTSDRASPAESAPQLPCRCTAADHAFWSPRAIL